MIQLIVVELIFLIHQVLSEDRMMSSHSILSDLTDLEEVLIVCSICQTNPGVVVLKYTFTCWLSVVLTSKYPFSHSSSFCCLFVNQIVVSSFSFHSFDCVKQ